MVRGGTTASPRSDRRKEQEPVEDPEVAEPKKAPQRQPRLALRGFLALFLILVGGAGVAIDASYEQVAKPALLGGNLPVNTGATDLADISAHNSPTVARNPVNAANLAIANRIDSPQFSCALHISTDGGASWAQTPIPAPPSEEPKCYAADVTYGTDGTLYLLFVTLKGEGNVPNGVWTATSSNGGRTLSDPRQALGPLAFQVRLMADPVTKGRLYLSWLQAASTATLAFPDTGNPVQFQRSDDGGATWSDPIPVSNRSRERVVAPSLAVGAGGDLYMLYLDLGDDRLDYNGGHQGQGGEPDQGPWQLVLARSTDKGATWSESMVEYRLVPAERFIVFIPPAPSLAVDPGGDNVYVSFTDRRLGDADVWLWASDDSGATFDEPRRVNDTPRKDGTSQYLPRLAVAPDGRLDVLYYDRRADKKNVQNEVSFQSSSNEGRSFTPSLRLSDRPFDSRIGPGSERGLTDLGSRVGLLSSERRALGVWSDTRAGTDASRKQDLVRALVDFPKTASLSEPVHNALRYGGGVLAAVGLLLLLSIPLGRRSRKPHSRP